MLDLKQEVLDASNKIHPYIRETPLEFSINLSKITQAHVYLKCENFQHTGSFKVRGAFNKLLSLSSIERKQGIVAASSGNHGAAIAFGCNKLNIPGIVFVPENTSVAKIENIRNYNISLEFYGNDCVQTEIYARDYAHKHNMVYISPYNDRQVVAGQGTIALEIAKQLNKIDVILAAIGGGGLIAGVASYVKSISPATQIFGCMPENSPVMAESIKAGKIIEMDTLPTLSDATAGGIEPGAVTFDYCKNLVDDCILVSESEIQTAIITLIKTHRFLIEGASGVVIASLLKNCKQFIGKNVVAILSGANISLDTLKTILK